MLISNAHKLDNRVFSLLVFWELKWIVKLHLIPQCMYRGFKSAQNFFCTRFGVCHIFFVGVPGHLFDHIRPLLVR